MSKQQKSKWKPKDMRFVAFLDILGFKDLVLRSTHDHVYNLLHQISITKKKLEHLINDDEEFELSGDAGINIVRFSDSIGVFSKKDDLDNFKMFSESVNFIFASAILQNIPLKGGMAYGEITLNQTEQICFGQPIIDAYLIEEEVGYFGVVAHNSIDAYIDFHSEIPDALLSSHYFSVATPLKTGLIYHRNAHWFNTLVRLEKPKDGKSYVESVVRKFRNTVSGTPRRYVDRTLDVLKNTEIDKNLLAVYSD